MDDLIYYRDKLLKIVVDESTKLYNTTTIYDCE